MKSGDLGMLDEFPVVFGFNVTFNDYLSRLLTSNQALTFFLTRPANHHFIKPRIALKPKYILRLF